MNQIETFPHSLPSERAVIGGIIYQNQELYEVLPFLNPEDFYHDGHARLYEWMRWRITLGQAVDIQIIFDQRPEKMDAWGGITYISEHLDVAIKGRELAEHGRRVKKFSRLRKLISAGYEIITKAQDQESDSIAIIEAAESVFADIGKSEASNLVTLEQIGMERGDHYSELQQKKESPIEISTGLIDLDTKIGGLHRREFTIIGARPSQGKTALAFQMFDWITEGGLKAVYFTPDQNRESLYDRTVSRHARIDGFRLRTGQLVAPDWTRVHSASAKIMRTNAWVDDTGGISLNQIRSVCRKLKTSVGLDVAFVDHVQLVTHALPRNLQGNVRQMVTEISHELKRLAKDLKIAMVAVSQLNRDIERYEKPELHHLKESGDLEQDADVVIFPWVGLIRKKNEPAEERTQLSVAKNKHGDTGEIRVTFLKSYTGFFDYQQQEEAQ